LIETNPTRRPRPSEEGYILIWIIFLLAVFAIAMTVAAPKVAKDIQLDRERETMERGKQYTRAVQLYYRKFHAFPPNIEALVKTNNIRFLRKKYIDPTTGKDDWKPIRFGQNKTPTAMGFFGQPLAGSASTIAGTGPSGGNQNPGGPFQQAAASSATSDPNNPNGTPGASATAPSTTGLTGQTFGGAGIIGFSPASAKPSILVYKKKSHYNEWEFVYDPLTEMKTISGNTNTGLNPTQTPPTPTPTPAPAPTPTPAPEQ
jgi:type II secretory pathway pseudopilin PulG